MMYKFKQDKQSFIVPCHGTCQGALYLSHYQRFFIVSLTFVEHIISESLFILLFQSKFVYDTCAANGDWKIKHGKKESTSKLEISSFKPNHTFTDSKIYEKKKTNFFFLPYLTFNCLSNKYPTAKHSFANMTKVKSCHANEKLTSFIWRCFRDNKSYRLKRR